MRALFCSPQEASRREWHGRGLSVEFMIRPHGNLTPNLIARSGSLRIEIRPLQKTPLVYFIRVPGASGAG